MNTLRFAFTPVCAAVLAGTALLSAGGGGDSDTSSCPPPATTQDVSTTVFDDALQNAIVCLDKNDNGACDAGEPSAKTAADGSARLKVERADVGKFTLLALVGTDAVDANTGPVSTAFSMRTPADQTALISALTTLVHAKMAQSGSTSAVADKAVQDAPGVSASMFSDFSKGADPAALAAIARLVVVAKQRASIALAAATATTTLDSSGATITKADVDRSVNNRLLDLLPSIVAAATSDAVGSATGSATDDAIKAAAQALVSNELALSVDTLKVVLGSTRTPDTLATAPTSGASLASFTGKPCVFGSNASTGPRNEWWSNSSINIGTVPGTVPVTGLYQSSRVIRAAFGTGNSLTYLNCALRIPEGSSRNCDPAGSGSYSIDTVGDARVLRFANVPAAATTLTYKRLFVERGRKVYFGYRDKLRVDHAARLNAEGMDALLGQLNLTR